MGTLFNYAWAKTLEDDNIELFCLQTGSRAFGKTEEEAVANLKSECEAFLRLKPESWQPVKIGSFSVEIA